MKKEETDFEERMWALWFTSVPGIGRRTLHRLEERFGSLGKAATAKEEDLFPVMKASQIKSLREFAPSPDGLLRHCERAGARYVAGLLLPECLRQIPDPPYGLFVKGALPDPDRPAVAMIGARACSGYGREAARIMGSAAAAAGIQVVSGMARGVDSISQMACLEAGGTSFGVLGSGVDVCYPVEARPLYDRLAKEGGVLSEYPLGTQPVAGNFPARNRLISGLADLVLVIEARERSGTLITVDMALEQGREVAVLPGRITDALSQGCYRLYEQGAHLVTSPQRMAELVWESFQAKHKSERLLYRSDTQRRGSEGFLCRNFEAAHTEKTKTEPGGGKEGEHLAASCLSLKQRQVGELLELTPQSAEQLYRAFLEKGGEDGLPEFLTILLELELRGMCESVGGMYRKREWTFRK